MLVYERRFTFWCNLVVGTAPIYHKYETTVAVSHFGYSACLLQARDLVQIGKLLAIVYYLRLYSLLCLLLGGTYLE
jgi:hypothetical protein